MQLLNAAVVIYKVLDGLAFSLDPGALTKVTELILEQLANAFFPNLRLAVELLKSTEVKLAFEQPLKQLSPMLVNVAGKLLKPVKLEQLLKQFEPIEVRLVGKALFGEMLPLGIWPFASALPVHVLNVVSPGVTLSPWKRLPFMVKVSSCIYTV